MYRVELKAFPLCLLINKYASKVPNVPCGVERIGQEFCKDPNLPVPNVPCGVESPITIIRKIDFYLFLMYRVELKGKN